MLPEISNNTKNILTSVKPFIKERFFSINTQRKVVNQSLFINKDNKLNIQDKLNTEKISIAKPNKISSSATIDKNTIKKVSEKVNSSTSTKKPAKSQRSSKNTMQKKNSGKTLNSSKKMTKVKKPTPNSTNKTSNKVKKASNSSKTIKKLTNNKSINKNINENSYFTRQLEEIKIEELLLANDTQISIVSGPSSCGKTKLIQNALQTLDIDYIILETNDFKNNKALYNTLMYQISPTMSANRRGRRISSSSSKKETINEEAILDLLKSIPEEVPIIIDDAFALFNYVDEIVVGEDDNEENELSLKINPIIFEWIYDCLENDKKLNMILVSSNPLVECWIDINIPNEIICYCPIRDLTYDEAQDFFNTYLYNEGIDTIDLTFEDVYPITGTRLSIIKDFIQEYIHRPYEDFNDLDFTTLNKIYDKLNNLLKNTEQPQLLKRIMAIMVSESDRGYVEEKELEYIFQNNQGFE
eukprot:jgi/Orpsp1_1/1180233/evm.model.c7180000072594.1